MGYQAIIKRCLLFFLILAAPLVAKDAKPLIVGMELSYYPFETIDEKGKPWGVSVDLSQALGNYLNRPVQIENIPFVGLIPALKSKKIDLIISSMSITPERQKTVAFSHPYLATGLCLLINKKTEGNTVDALDIEGNQIVVKLGTTAEIFARKYFKHAKMLVLDRESNCVLEVVQGKSNAFIYDQFSVLKDWQKYPEATRANLKPFIEEFWAIALRPEDKNLLKSVNDFLQNYRQQGGFQNLADKYFEKEQKLFAEQGVPFVFDIKATRKD